MVEEQWYSSRIWVDYSDDLIERRISWTAMGIKNLIRKDLIEFVAVNSFEIDRSTVSQQEKRQSEEKKYKKPLYDRYLSSNNDRREGNWNGQFNALVMLGAFTNWTLDTKITSFYRCVLYFMNLLNFYMDF